MQFIESIREKAREANKTIIFPEGTETRTLMAVEYLSNHRLVKPVLLGDPNEISALARRNNIDLKNVDVIKPETSVFLKEFSAQFFEQRQGKIESVELANEILRQPLYFGAMMVRTGRADGSVAGAINATGDVLRAAIQVLGTAENVRLVSSDFLMVLPDGRVFSYADCAVVPQPDAAQLADIAISTAKTHVKLTGEKPVIAMLSFSTKGSARHEMVDKVQKAVELARAKAPDLPIDGELQFDAAVIKSIGERKAPGSAVAGNANVFIFPDLNAGNISYKITERLGGAQAIGPVLQGLAKPVNDLSRGCSWQDISDVACITSLLN